MSAEVNKALIRRVYQAIDSGNLAAFDEIMSADYVDHSLPPALPPTREGFKALLGVFRSAFPDLYQEVEDVIAEGDRVVARSTIHGTHQGEFFGIPATGKRVAMMQIHIARVADGRIVEHWAVQEDLSLMQQLGVVPTAEAVPA